MKTNKNKSTSIFSLRNIGKSILASLCLTLAVTPVKAKQGNENMPRLSVQLWSVKDTIKKDYDGTLEALAKMGFEGVEFANEFGPYKNSPEKLKAKLDSLGLEGSGAHIKFTALNDENFDSTVALYKALNVKMLLISSDKRAFDPQGIKEVVRLLNSNAVKLAKYGMKVGFHNHDEEFFEYNNSTYWDYMAKHTNDNVVLQQDVGWTTYAGKDPVEYVKRYPNRTLTTHYKVKLPEGTQGKLPIIGQDTIDWLSLLQANIEFGGTQWIVVEQEEYPNGLTQLEAVSASKKGLKHFIKQL